MADKVHKCNVKREQGYLYYIDSRGNVGRFHSQSRGRKEIICPNGGEFTKEPGWLYYLDKDGDVSRSRMKGFREWNEVREELGDNFFVVRQLHEKHEALCSCGRPSYLAQTASSNFNKVPHCPKCNVPCSKCVCNNIKEEE